MEILSALSSDMSIRYMPDILRPYLLDGNFSYMQNLSAVRDIFSFLRDGNFSYMQNLSAVRDIFSFLRDLDRLPSIISELSALFKDFSSKMDCKTLLLKILEWVIPPLIKLLAWFPKQWLYTMVEKAINYTVDTFLSRGVNYIFPVETATNVTQFLRWILQVGARILVDQNFQIVTSWVTGLLLQLVQVKPKIEESNIPEDTSQNTEVKVKEKKEEANNHEHMGHNMNMHREAFRGTKRKRWSEVTAEVTAMNPKRLCKQF